MLQVFGDLNPEGHKNRITGSKVMAILLNGWILPIGGASSGRFSACSLRSRLVYERTKTVCNQINQIVDIVSS